MTYNHEPFIARAIESALNQNTNFDYEIVIGDDFSTDRNPEIIVEFAQKYPDKIVFLNRPRGGEYDQERQRIGRIYNFYNIMQNCRGKYIALLDGDDYWTDTNKLQKQVDFLESHPEYAFSCHGYSKVDEAGNFIEVTDAEEMKNHPDGFEINLNRFFGKWATQTLSTVLRKDTFQFDFENYQIINDYVLFYTSLRKHKGYYKSFNGGGYTIQQTGIFAGQDRLKRLEYNFKVKSIVARNNSDEPLIQKVFIEEHYRVLNYLLKQPLNKRDTKKTREYALQLLKNTSYSQEAIRYISKNMIFPRFVRLKMRLRGMVDKEFKAQYLEK